MKTNNGRVAKLNPYLAGALGAGGGALVTYAVSPRGQVEGEQLDKLNKQYVTLLNQGITARDLGIKSDDARASAQQDREALERLGKNARELQTEQAVHSMLAQGYGLVPVQEQQIQNARMQQQQNGGQR